MLGRVVRLLKLVAGVEGLNINSGLVRLHIKRRMSVSFTSIFDK